MQVILQETVTHLGMIGDVVDVAPGYYRNYLGPKHLALMANPKSIKQLEHQKKIVKVKLAKAKTEALSVKEKMEALSLTLEHAAGSGDKLFGSITNQEIVLLLHKNGFEVDRKYLILEAPIKTVGEHEFKIKLHPDVVAELKLVVHKKAEKKELKDAKTPEKKREKKVEEKVEEKENTENKVEEKSA